jgi:outer membrane protein
MKKIITGLMVAASIASADFLSFSFGGGMWHENIAGYTKVGNTINYFGKHSPYGGDVGYLGLKDETKPYIWAKLIHPIPLVPNVKLQYTRYDSTGYSNYIAGDVKVFGDINLQTAITNASTSQTISSYDLTFFYEFKPVVADIEFGFGVDYWKGHTKIYGTEQSTGETKTWVDSDWSVPLPYLYAHLETMHLFGFSVLGNVKWARAGDNHHYDYIGAVKYTIDVPGPVNGFVKAGYRYKEAYGVDGDNETKLQYRGPFMEAGVRF